MVATGSLVRLARLPFGTNRSMLRKGLWTGLYAGLGAAATMAARVFASRIWRLTTGEDPPTRR
jgi:hypothetical protein